MLKRNKRFMTAICGILLTSAFSVTSFSSVSAASTNRLWGQDRYETSAAISKSGWTSSDYVVVASGEGYADALCAAPLAKKYNAPIILTESKNLNEKAKEEIKRLNAKHAIIIGKYGAVSQSAEDDLKSITGDVKRLGGNDRYETSVIVAKELGTVDKVAVTSGGGFADALSIAPIAAAQNMPILLSGKDTLPDVVKGYINDNKDSIKNSYIIGGTGVISDAAKAQAPSAERLSGQNRFETNLNVMKYFQSSLKFDNIYVVEADGPTGNEFADALSGAALAVKSSSPVVLTYKTLSTDIQSFIKSNSTTSTSITALGGEAAVPEVLVSNLESAIQGTTNTTTPGTSSGSGGSSGGSSSGGSSSGSTTGSTTDDKNQELKTMVTKLNAMIPNLQTENEKTLVSKAVTSINNYLSNSSYDYKSDANKLKQLKSQLTQAEKNDLISKATGQNLSVFDLLDLENQFGL